MIAFTSDDFTDLFNRIFSFSEDERDFALGELEQIKDKKILDAIAKELILKLDQERDNEIRGFAIAALGTIRRGKKTLRKYTSAKTVNNTWVRRLAVAALAKASDNDQLLKEMQTFISYEDDEAPVRAVALRILVENGYEKGFAKQLEEMFRNQGTKGIACVSFRQYFDTGGNFSDEMILKFTELLVDQLFDTGATDDCQEEAIWALAELKQRYPENDRLSRLGYDFSEVLKMPEKNALKRRCIELIDWLELHEATSNLPRLLGDSDDELRKHATKTLSTLLGRDGAINVIIEDLINNEPISSEGINQYIEALRKLDPNLAFQLLIDHLELEINDVKKEYITKVLDTLVDQFPALRLSSRRKDTFDTYTSFLEQTNRELIGQFNHLKWQTSLAFYSHIGIFLLVSLLALSVLIYSLYKAFSNTPTNDSFSFQVSTAIVSLVVLFILFARNPLTSSRKMITDISKSAIILMGYLRQINQIDAAFKQYVLMVSEFEPEKVEKTIKYLQAAMEGSIDGLSQALEEFKI